LGPFPFPCPFFCSFGCFGSFGFFCLPFSGPVAPLGPLAPVVGVVVVGVVVVVWQLSLTRVSSRCTLDRSELRRPLSSRRIVPI
jgi:hypothetical protein